MITLKEKNKKAQEKAVWNNPEMKALRESAQKQFGIDMRDEKKLPVSSSDFSWKKFKERALKEAISASSFPQLERVGVQAAVNQLYQSVEDTYSDWTHIIASDKDTELYAPLHGITFPGNVGPAEKFIESNMAGLDIKLRNRKFGQLFTIERELDEDDQTAQTQNMVALMAEYAKLVAEVYCYGKLASVSGMQYSNLTVPTSETKPSTETNYPFTTSAAPFVGGGYNRPTSFAALAQDKIQDGIIALMNQLNLLGLKMLIKPDTIIIGPRYRFDLSVLMNSAYYPSGAAAAGNVGGAFAINPIFNALAKPVISRFMFDQNGSVNANSKAWYITDSSKPWFVLQMREAANVTQENPQAGESFDRDILRWKMRVRLNADFIDPRFVWQGNNGSV
jgi:hypothetical protein